MERYTLKCFDVNLLLENILYSAVNYFKAQLRTKANFLIFIMKLKANAFNGWLFDPFT